ncbi:MAG: transglycosylase domain-containing protein [Firmicutes bacterium]|nr:transglycosylase domain-containing protein [Bacillota bacterium]
MSEDFGRKYDQDVLKAFDRMADEYEKLSPDAGIIASEDGDVRVTEEDIFGELPAKNDVTDTAGSGSDEAAAIAALLASVGTKTAEENYDLQNSDAEYVINTVPAAETQPETAAETQPEAAVETETVPETAEEVPEIKAEAAENEAQPEIRPEEAAPAAETAETESLVTPGRSLRGGRHAKRSAADIPVGEPVSSASLDAKKLLPERRSRKTEEQVTEEGAEVKTAEKTAEEKEPVVAERSRRWANSAKAAKPAKPAKEKKADKPEKEKKPKKKRKHIFLKILLILICLAMVACVAAAALVGKYMHNVIQNTPEINPSNIYDLLSENSVLYAADGSFMENVYAGDSLRSNIEYKDLPDNLINAFVAIEDKTFWEHHGFNYVRIIGAIVDSLRNGTDISGTSTITQQLARNLYLPEVKSVRSMERKISEMYYALILEQSLTKEQIIEAYLNTIYLGFNSNGVAAAAKAYFDKDVSDLTLIECAELAALPKNPNSYAPIKRASVESIDDPDSLDIVSKDDGWIIYYNNKGEARLSLVLRLMNEQGYITDSQLSAAKKDSIRSHIKPGNTILESSNTSYFADFVLDQVLKDLQDELGYTADEASKMLYNGGLLIHSTMDPVIQGILEEEYANTDNFPSVGSYDQDKQGNILNSTNKKVLLYSMANMFNEDGDFILGKDAFEWQANGNLKLLKDHHLNFYKTTVGETTDYSVEFKPMFEKEDGFFFSRAGGYLSIPTEFKDRTAEGDLIVSKEFLSKYKDAFTEQGDGSLVFSQKYFTISDRVRQPQSAMVIMDHSNGQIHAMIGGRDIEGKRIFNRATSPRQPGSSIKPLAVYSVALQAGKNGLGNFTAATAIDDRPISQGGRPWPKNWYAGYRGMTNLRNAVEQSINACAVNLYLQLDPYMCIDNLQKMGVTSLVTSGNVNDINASALALGGMTKGISPLEMCGAYGTFGNYGTYIEPVAYTVVTNKKGDVVLRKVPHTTEVLDEDVASLMTDILRTTVTHGLASGAKLSNQPSAGKTGTTSDRYDIWFCGLTPKYAATTWIGNDVNISLNKGSDAAVKLWKAVMDRVDDLDERGEFEMRGEFVTATVDRYSGKALGSLSSLDPRGSSGISEKFIKGTVPGETDDSHKTVRVCTESGYLATPYCPGIVEKVGIVRPGGTSWERYVVENHFTGLSRDSEPDAKYDAPEYYCPLHNPTPASYPISPIYDGTAIDNPSNTGSLYTDNENGYWTTDPATGLPKFIEYNDQNGYWTTDPITGEPRFVPYNNTTTNPTVPVDPTIPTTDPDVNTGPLTDPDIDDSQIPEGAPGYVPPGSEPEEDPNW